MDFKYEIWEKKSDEAESKKVVTSKFHLRCVFSVQSHQQGGLLCFWILCAWSLLLMFISMCTTPRR